MKIQLHAKDNFEKNRPLVFNNDMGIFQMGLDGSYLYLTEMMGFDYVSDIDELLQTKSFDLGKIEKIKYKRVDKLTIDTINPVYFDIISGKDEQWHFHRFHSDYLPDKERPTLDSTKILFATGLGLWPEDFEGIEAKVFQSKDNKHIGFKVGNATAFVYPQLPNAFYFAGKKRHEFVQYVFGK